MWAFTPVEGAKYKHDYVKVCGTLNQLQEKGDHKKYKALIRKLCKKDLFFLAYFILRLNGEGQDSGNGINHPWLVERIRGVERKHNRTLDLWPREHYKSSIITFAYIIQCILKNPEERIAIFSFSREIAKGFLKRIKEELNMNELLKLAFDDVLFENPENESPQWTTEGITIRRRGTYNSATIEAWGITRLPTSRHYTKRFYDDLVTDETINPANLRKTQRGFRQSHNLGTTPGEMMVVGTTYHYLDIHSELVEEAKRTDNWHVRRYPCWDENRENPVFMTQEQLEQKLEDMKEDVFSAQMELNPIPDSKRVLNVTDIMPYRKIPVIVKKFILVDPAKTKKKTSDWTVIAVIGLDIFGNYYVLDIIRDRLYLEERWERTLSMVLKWSCQDVGYETYGQQDDERFFHLMMMRRGIYFNFIPLGGKTPKMERIANALRPLFKEHRFYFPEELIYYSADGTVYDIRKIFFEDEVARFPVPITDDLLDCISRLADPQIMEITPITPSKVTMTVRESIIDDDDFGEDAYDFMGA